MFKVSFPSAVMLAAVTSAAAATPILIEEKRINLPDSVYSESGITFKDVNRDGRPDIHIQRPDRIATVDLQTGEVIDYFYPLSSSLHERVVTGHFDSDKRLDLAVVKRISDLANQPLVLILYLSSDAISADTVEILSSTEPDSRYVDSPRVTDKDGDGIEEIWSGYYYETCYWYFQVEECYSGGETFVYNAKEDSLTLDVNLPGSYRHTYTYGDLSLGIEMPRFHSIREDWSGTGLTDEKSFKIEIYEHDTLNYAQSFNCPFHYGPSIQETVYSWADYGSSWLSNLVGAASRPELVITQSNNLWGTGSPSESQSSKELRCFQIVGGDTLVELWSTPYSYTSAIFAVADYPNVFFTLEAYDSLFERSAYDGSRRGASLLNGPSSDKYVQIVQYDGQELIAFAEDKTISFYRLGIATGVTDGGADAAIPRTFELHAPYPNPFNDEAAIMLEVLSPGHLLVAVYNSLGREVVRLYDRPVSPGSLNLTWDASTAPSGVYFIQARMGETEARAQMVLTK